MLQARFGVPSCIERERLEFELLEVPRPRAVSGATALPEPRRAGPSGTGGSGRRRNGWSIMAWSTGAAVEDLIPADGENRLAIVGTTW
jgi:hypothetical protein